MSFNFKNASIEKEIMDRIIVKNLVIYSLILGIVLGLLASIPLLGVCFFACMLILSAPLVMVYLIMDSKLDLTTINNSIITGSIVGFVSSFFFTVLYSIMIALLHVGFHYSANQVLTSIVMNSPAWLLIIFMLFIGVFSGVTNAFSGVLTYYVINLIRDMYEKEHPTPKEEEY